MNWKNLRKLVAGLTVAAAAVATAGCSTDSAGDGGGDTQELETVRMGYLSGLEAASMLAIADAEGYWAEEGLVAETINFTSGPTEINAFAAGSLDFAFVGPGALWMPADGKAKILTPTALDRSASVIAQPGIDSMEGLRGKKVGVPEGTTGEMIVDLALKEAGMTRDDIEVVPMDPSTAVSAFSAGQIDGAGLWFPLIDSAREQVPDLGRIVAIEDMESTFFMGYVVNNTIVDERPETVERVARVLRKALDFRAENQEETIELTAEFLDADPAVLAKEVDYVGVVTSEEVDGLIEDGSIVDWLSDINDYFVATGKLASAVDPSTYFLGDMFLQAGK